MQAQTSTPSSLPHLIKYSGVLKDADRHTGGGTVGVIFAIYDKEDSVAPVWLETQSVTADESGHYNALLGSTKSEGLPASIFSSGEARWIGVTAEGAAEQQRTLLVSVPYALKAADADTLGGKPLSAFVLANASGSGSKALGVAEGGVAQRDTTGTISSTTGSAGFVAKFQDASTILNSLLFDSGTRIGLGTTVPVSKFNLAFDGASDYLSLSAYQANLFDKGFLVRSARGPANAPTTTANNDILFNLYAQGHDGTDYGIAAGITMAVDGTVATAKVPGRIVFNTTNSAGAFTERMRVDSVGRVGIGTATPATTLDVNGTTRSTWIQFGDGTIQTTAAVGGGSITGITAGSGLSGGGSTGSLTLSVDNSVARTNASNNFGANQFISGDLNLSGTAAVNGSAGNFIGPNGGVLGRDTTQDGLGRVGVQGLVDSSQGRGVFGEAFSTTGSTDGVLGISKSSDGAGVFGHATSLTGTTAGVHGLTHSSSTLSGAGWFDNDSQSGGNIIIGRGGPSLTTIFKVDTSGNVTANGTLYGQSIASSPIFPSLNSPPPAAVRGDATATSNYAAGVLGGSFSPDGYGVLGANFATSGNAFGVVGFAGNSSSGTGILGQASATTGFTAGMWGLVNSAGGTAAYFENDNSAGNLVIGVNATQRVFRVNATGFAFLAGSQVGGADFAESVDVVGSKTRYEPGDLLIIDSESDRRLRLSNKPYSTMIAGIYSTKPGVLATPHAMDDARIVEAEVPLAVVGIVPCKVSAENGPIQRGDLLVSSSIPGYAMKGTVRGRMLGAVVGKALQPLQRGKGVIEILVTLQ
jgi:hypothetical protein